MHGCPPEFRASNSIVQFNCLYRWHATASQADEQWVEQFTSRNFPETRPDEVNNSSSSYSSQNLNLPIHYTDHCIRLQGEDKKDPVRLRWLHNLDFWRVGFPTCCTRRLIDQNFSFRLERGPDGKFDDTALANILKTQWAAPRDFLSLSSAHWSI